MSRAENLAAVYRTRVARDLATSEWEDAICAALLAGTPARIIASESSTSTTQITRVAQRNGLTNHGSRIAPDWRTTMR